MAVLPIVLYFHTNPLQPGRCLFACVLTIAASVRGDGGVAFAVSLVPPRHLFVSTTLAVQADCLFGLLAKEE